MKRSISISSTFKNELLQLKTTAINLFGKDKNVESKYYHRRPNGLDELIESNKLSSEFLIDHIDEVIEMLWMVEELEKENKELKSKNYGYDEKGENIMFKKATKKQQKLRLLLEGASGSGKTYGALTLASTLGKKIAVLDTERGSASLYSDKFNFDVSELEPPFTPEAYIKIIKGAELAGYDVLVIDSITHEWSGQGGCLDIQTALGGQFTHWAKVTPRHKAFIDAILQSKMHIIATARTKTDYILTEKMNKAGKTVNTPEKAGMKSEQREGLDYEFTIVFRLNQNHLATASKDRTSIFDNMDEIITSKMGETLLGWLNSGEELKPEPKPEPKPAINRMMDYLKTAGLSIDQIKEFAGIHGISRENPSRIEELLSNELDLQILIQDYLSSKEAA